MIREQQRGENSSVIREQQRSENSSAPKSDDMFIQCTNGHSCGRLQVLRPVWRVDKCEKILSRLRGKLHQAAHPSFPLRKYVDTCYHAAALTTLQFSYHGADLSSRCCSHHTAVLLSCCSGCMLSWCTQWLYAELVHAGRGRDGKVNVDDLVKAFDEKLPYDYASFDEITAAFMEAARTGGLSVKTAKVNTASRCLPRREQQRGENSSSVIREQQRDENSSVVKEQQRDTRAAA